MSKLRPSGGYRALRSFQTATLIYDATSSQTELRLVNVARASLDELLLDYEDFLRHRHLKMWAPDSPEAMAVRRLGRKHPSDPSDQSDENPTTPSMPSGWITRTPPFAPMPCYASSTRQTICSTNKSKRWKRSLSKRAATANNWRRHAWRSEPQIGPLRRICQMPFPLVPSAVNP